MDWLEITVRTNTAGADMVSEQLMLAGASGTSILDPGDAIALQEGPLAWDLLDPAFLENLEDCALVKGYLPCGPAVPERVASLRTVLAGLTTARLGFDPGPLTVTTADVRDEDWAETWKQYYKPFRAGRGLVVKPRWEAFEAGPTDLVIEIDPGPAFGNGTHETTALCLRLLEEIVRPGDSVLDVGTGSGILALAAALLGAAPVLAVDLDPLAVRVARENVALNGLTGAITVREGNLLAGVDAKAGVIVANIIADAVIALSGAAKAHLLPGGAFIASGVIRAREQDVAEALANAGFSVERVEREGEWSALVARG